jgi:hypothetical protein
MSDEDVQALVVDNGSGMCKVMLFIIFLFKSSVLNPKLHLLHRLVLREMMLQEQYFLRL